MNPNPSRPRSKRSIREKRREFFLGVLAKVLGSVAMILMVAAVFKVVMAKLWDLPPIADSPPPAHFDSVVAPSLVPETEPRNAVAEVVPPSLPVPVQVQVQASAPEVAPPAVPRAVPVQGPLAESMTAALPTPAVSGIEKIETKQSQISQALAGFYTAKSLDEKYQWVRDPERVRPLMEAFYATHELRPLVWKGLGWAKSVAEPGYRFGYVQALFEGGAPVSVIIEELSSGRVVVDWESSVRYGELSWREFLQARPERPTLLRMLASRPTHPLPAPVFEGAGEKLEVLLLKHPSDDASMEAVFDPTDPQLNPLVDQLQAGQWKEVPVTLRVCFPGAEIQSNVKMARITAVEGRGWLILPQKRS